MGSQALVPLLFLLTLTHLESSPVSLLVCSQKFKSVWLSRGNDISSLEQLRTQEGSMVPFSVRTQQEGSVLSHPDSSR